MKACTCFLISLSILAGSLPAQGKEPFPKLGDATGGDCALNYLVYDKVYRHSGDFRNATPIINDVCNLGNYIRIVADGEEQNLDYVRGKTKDKLSGTKSLYANARFSVFLEIGRPLYKVRDVETGCTETGYFVRATIGHAGRKKVIEGTLTGGCP